MSSAATDPRSIPARLNLLLAVLALTMSGWLWIVLPLLLPALPALGWSLLIVVLATTFYWSLLHEGIHAVLLPNRRLNDVLSRLLAIGFPAPFAVLRFGHLKHHQFNRIQRVQAQAFFSEKQAVIIYVAGANILKVQFLHDNLLEFLPDVHVIPFFP